MTKTILSAFALLVSLFTGSSAFAADTWLPDFNPEVHVYVREGMNNPVNLSSNFEALVSQKAATNNLSTYIVVTEQGDELSSGSRDSWAPDMLHNRLWDRWRHESSFSEDRVLIILYIRAKDSTSGSIAVRSGSFLHGKGLDRARFGSASGPVMPAAKQYMRTDPQTGLLTILDNINAELAGGQGASSSSFWTTPWLFGWPAWVWIVIITIIVIVIIVAIANASSGGGGSSGGGWFFAGCGGGSSGGGGGCGGGGCGGGGGC